MSRPRPGRGRRALATALLALGALAGSSATAALAAPTTTATTTTADVAAAEPALLSTVEAPVTVAISEITPQVLQPDQDLTITVTLRNDGEKEITSPRVSARIYRYRMTTREQVAEWTAAGHGSPVGDVAATLTLDAPLAPGATTQVTITVPARSIGLLRSADAWGPRGLAVDVTDGATRVGIDRSYLIWSTTEDVPTAQVAVLAAVTGPATDPGPNPTVTAKAADATGTTDAQDSTGAEGGGSGDELDTQTASGGRLSRLLQATSAHPDVSWAVDPALVNRAATGSRAARSWLEGLTAAAEGREVLRLPWSDPDLATLAHADTSSSADLLQLAVSTDQPTTKALLTDANTILWGAGELDQDTVDLVGEVGLGQALVTAPDAVPTLNASTGTSATEVSSADAGSTTALVPDGTLSALLESPGKDATAATAAQRMLAETAVLALEQRNDATPVLATIGRDWSAGTPVTEAQLTALESAGWVQNVSVQDLLDTHSAGQESQVARADLPDRIRDDSELPPSWVNALAGDWRAAQAFGSVVPDPDTLLNGLDGDLLAPLSVAWRADPEGRAAAVDSARAESSARQSGLSVVLNEQFTVISSSAQITVTVRNELDQNAAVRVEMRPQKGCLETARSSLVEVVASGETQVKLTLHATANCDVSVDVSLVSESGRELANPVTFSARVAPTIENVGAIVIGILLALGLAFGIWRTVRRGQTARRGAKVNRDGDDGHEPDGPDDHPGGGPDGDGPSGGGGGGTGGPPGPQRRTDAGRADPVWHRTDARAKARSAVSAPVFVPDTSPLEAPWGDLRLAETMMIAAVTPEDGAPSPTRPPVSTDSDAASAGSGSLGRSSLIMASGTAVSRVLGVVNTSLLAWAIGLTGNIADAFSVANKLPNTLYLLIAGGVLNAVLVPQVVRAYRRADGQTYVNRLLTVGMAGLAALTLILTATAPLWVRLYSDYPDPRATTIATALAFWCIPQVFFYGVYSLLGQVLNARGSFGPYMWAPVVNNIVFIAGLLVFSRVFGRVDATTDLDSWSAAQTAVLGGTATCGIVAQAAILLVPLYRSGFRYRPKWGLRGSGLGSAGRVATWTFAGLLVGQVGVWAVSVVASSVPTGLAGNAVYDRAFLIFMLPHSLVTVSLATALFTRLSGRAASGDTDGVRGDLSLGLRIVGLFTVLATTGVAVLALPIGRLLFPGQTDDEVHALASVMVALVLGLVPFGAWSLCQRVFYAYEDARAMFPVQVLMAVIVVGGTLAGRAVLDPVHWVAAACGSMAASYLVGAATGLVLLRRRLHGVDGARVTQVHVKAIIGAAAAAVAGVGVQAVLGPVRTFTDALVACLVGGGVMTIVYVVVLTVLRVRELRSMAAPLLRRLSRR